MNITKILILILILAVTAGVSILVYNIYFGREYTGGVYQTQRNSGGNSFVMQKNFDFIVSGNKITLRMRAPCFVTYSGKTFSDMTLINGMRAYLISFNKLNSGKDRFYYAIGKIRGYGEWQGEITFIFENPYGRVNQVWKVEGDPKDALWDALWIVIDAPARFWTEGVPPHLCIPFDNFDRTIPSPIEQFARKDVLGNYGIEAYFYKDKVLPVNYVFPKRPLRPNTGLNIYLSFPKDP